MSNIIDFGLLQDKKMIALSWRKIDVAIDICMSGLYNTTSFLSVSSLKFFVKYVK